MPRKSFRVRALEHVLLTYRHVCRLFAFDNIHQLAEGDLDDDIFDDHNDLFVLAACLHGRIQEIHHSRYLKRQCCRKGSINVFQEDLAEDNGINSWMSDDKFLCKYRVNRDQLERITTIIADDLVFSQSNRGFPQMPVKHQLMIWLHFIGHEGQ